MLKLNQKMTAILLLHAFLLQGCAQGPFRLQYLWHDDPQLSYYVDKASAIEYPTQLEHIEPRDPKMFEAPRGLASLDELDPREISLNECIRLALSQSSIIRDDQSFGSPSNPIFSRPAQVASTLDHAIQNTGFLFGNRGYEAALTDFDALFTTSATWGRDEVPQNAGSFGIPSGGSQVNETFGSQTRLEKPLANGGTVSLQNDLNYDGNNRPSGGFQQPLFASSFTSLLQAEYRQPLWAGAGTEFTRIAGPANQSLRGVSGVSQGVLISRINSDISLTQFEQSVQGLVRDVENLYWDLSLFLRLYESEKDSFEDLRTYYQRIKLRKESSVPRLAAEARLYEADARLQGSLADVIQRERRLRRLCHMDMSDGTFLYPSDQPTEARFQPSWEPSLQEAFSHRVELRRQKWEIKSLELQLKAARSLTRPRLDLVSQYRVNALGDHLLGNQDSQLDTVVGNLAGNQNTGWSIGFQMTAPLGFRLARIQERNYELRLRKARVVLGEQERDISYEIADAVGEMERWYALADRSVPRMEVQHAHTNATLSLISGQRGDIPAGLFENLLNAKIQERDAEQAYLQSIIEYNKAIANFRFRKGTILVDNEIYLAEGNWHPGAANIAMQRAEGRTYAKDSHKLRTVPMEFVGGFAPGSYESLGMENRPSTPGQDFGQPVNKSDLESPSMPRMLEPIPVPPVMEAPVPVPPPTDVVPADDNITKSRTSLQNVIRTSGLAPAATNSDDTGRVRL